MKRSLEKSYKIYYEKLYPDLNDNLNILFNFLIFYFNIKENSLLSKKRTEDLVFIRYIYVLATLNIIEFPKLSNKIKYIIIGNKVNLDRTTVFYVLRLMKRSNMKKTLLLKMLEIFINEFKKHLESSSKN